MTKIKEKTNKFSIVELLMCTFILIRTFNIHRSFKIKIKMIVRLLLITMKNHKTSQININITCLVGLVEVLDEKFI